jgi:nitrate reductase (NAD(P)H)
VVEMPVDNRDVEMATVAPFHSIPLPPVSKRPTKVLDIDKDTPDRHVPRDPRLIRLTGVHPLNVEAPLTTLYDEGI